ncbi:MAG: membrane integrity-associated transporter subunit PqiC [Gammaproteobacteria bacterium]
MRLAACLLAYSLMAAACSVRSPAVDYWTLAALAPAPATLDPAAPAVAIAPVALPRYLDRPQVLVRLDPSRVEPDGQHRWADPLDEGFGRTLATNLGRGLGSGRVSAYPVQPPYEVDYRVQVDVQRFDGRPGETVELAARYVILAGRDRQVLAVEQVEIGIAAGEDFAAFIGAHSAAVAELATHIDASLVALLKN